MKLISIDWAKAAEIASVTAATITVILTSTRKPFSSWWHWVGKILNHLNPFGELHRDNKEIKETLELVSRELKPNGGNSLMDKVEHMSKKVDTIWSHIGVNRALLDLIFDESPMLLWRSDPLGRHERANRAMLKMLGRPQSDLVGHGWQNVIHYLDREDVGKEWASCLIQERDFQIRCRILDVNDHVYDVVLTAKPLRFDGSVLGWMGQAIIISRDSADKKDKPRSEYIAIPETLKTGRLFR